MKKLVIFDLDGTLLNTIADLAAATNQALQYYGYPIHDTDAYRFFVGNGINKLFERALPENERSEENILKIRSQFVPYYDKHNADFSRPYPGIAALLLALQNDGRKIAVASNKYQAATRKLIAHYFPEINFVEVLGQREGIPAKPDPSIVNDIIYNRRVRLGRYSFPLSQYFHKIYFGEIVCNQFPCSSLIFIGRHSYFSSVIL